MDVGGFVYIYGIFGADLGKILDAGKRKFAEHWGKIEISRLEGDDLKAFRYSMRYVDERQLAIDCAVEEATEAAIVQSKLETAVAMLADGLEPERVARLTKLPLRQVKRLH